MAILPIPERGQPIDVAYLRQVANAINEISAQMSPAAYRYFTVDTTSAGPQSVRTSDARVIGGYIEVANNSVVNAGNEKSFFYDFPADFKFAPIAVATPLNLGDTAAGRNVSVILKDVTTSRVEGIVKFNSPGEVSVAVNLVIIGIPN